MAHNDDQSKPESPSQLFCERVTVAGVEDLYIAKFPPIRYLFAVGLVLSTLFGLLTSYRTVQQTLEESASVNIQFKDDGGMLFPNLTICTTSLINATAARELMVVPKAVEEKLKKAGINRTQLIEEAIGYLSSIYSHPRIPLQYIQAVWDASMATIRTDNGYNDHKELSRTFPPCNLTLSNCTYDGNPIDCCNANQLSLSFSGIVCYGVPLSTMPREQRPFTRPIVFNVDVRMDWAHIPWVMEEDALDGFLVIVSEPYTTMNTAPVAVAPGWHGTIKLARIRRRTDRTDCVPRNKLPVMKYTSYYDQDGKNCELELGFDEFQSILQCTPSFGIYLANSTLACSVQQITASRLSLTGDVDDSTLLYYIKAFRARVGSYTKQCKPICQHWQYEPIVGYSELRDSQGRSTDANANISWSRITVTIPSEYYEEPMEEERPGVYVIFCNVGGAMGVCLGLSAVTLIQVVAYGLQSCYMYKRNRKRVHPN